MSNAVKKQKQKNLFGVFSPGYISISVVCCAIVGISLLRHLFPPLSIGTLLFPISLSQSRTSAVFSSAWANHLSHLLYWISKLPVWSSGVTTKATMVCPTQPLSHGKGCPSSVIWDISLWQASQSAWGSPTLRFLSPGHLLTLLPPRASWTPPWSCSSTALWNPSGPLWCWNPPSEGVPILTLLLHLLLLSFPLPTASSCPLGSLVSWQPPGPYMTLSLFLLGPPGFVKGSLSYCKCLDLSTAQPVAENWHTRISDSPIW